jgi:hypothetical protein
MFKRLGFGLIGAIVTIFSVIALPIIAVYGLKIATEDEWNGGEIEQAVWIHVGAAIFVISVMVCPLSVIYGLNLMLEEIDTSV